MFDVPQLDLCKAMAMVSMLSLTHFFTSFLNFQIFRLKREVFILDSKLDYLAKNGQFKICGSFEIIICAHTFLLSK